jgi:hypothetical protein
MPVPLTTAIRLSPAALAVLLLAAPAAASTLQVLYHADDEGSSGANLLTPVLVSGGGVMTGTLNGRGGTDSGSGDVFLLSPGKKGAAYTKTLLHVFAGGNDGTSPTSLIADKKGNVWGVTNAAGANNAGVLFELMKPARKGSWTYRVVLQMPAALSDSRIGSGYGQLVFDPKGNLFGVYNMGGNQVGCDTGGCGQFFEVPAVDLNGGTKPVTTLFTFPVAGGVPGGLARDAHGNFYGTTFGAGTAGMGTVWQLIPPAKRKGVWTEQIVHNFCAIPDQYGDCPDGSNPTGAPAIDANGVLCGTTFQGGAGVAFPQGGLENGSGVVWSLAPQGGGNWTLTSLWTLYGSVNLNVPGPDYFVSDMVGQPVLGPGGIIESVALSGGEDYNGNTPVGAFAGGIVAVPSAGGGDALYNNGFSVPGAQVDGPETPSTTVVADKSGNLYGASEEYYVWNGPNLEGVIYEITP